MLAMLSNNVTIDVLKHVLKHVTYLLLVPRPVPYLKTLVLGGLPTSTSCENVWSRALELLEPRNEWVPGMRLAAAPAALRRMLALGPQGAVSA